MISAPSAADFRARLDADDQIDLTQIDSLSRTLNLDLLDILAGWTPVLLRLYSPHQPPAPLPPLHRSWWRRFLDWRKAR